MKEYKNNKGERIVEYGFEDWKAGKHPVDRNKSGYKRIKKFENGEIYFNYLPIKELGKIRTEQERIFWDCVQIHLNSLKCKFTELAKQSGNKDRLLKVEIDKWEYIFFPETQNGRKPPLGLDISKFRGFDFFYEKLFIRRDFDFSGIDYNEVPTLTIANVPASIYAKAQYLEWLKEKLNEKPDNKPLNTILPTKTNRLQIELEKYGFFELPKVKQLSEPNKQSLIEMISANNLPYRIAMIEYLGFIQYLKAEHFKTDNKLFKAVANWFEVADRAVKGNIYVLNEMSNENRTRYTADQQKQIVQKNYEALK